jgi:hypothetical protein
MKILSIDIGISNLGYCYTEITFPELTGSRYKNLINNEVYSFERFEKLINVISCNRIDITKVKHTKVKYCDCKLRHERCIPDYLDHFVQEYCDFFENCDILLLERQPPVGITNVQDLLFTKFRDKVLLISPNSVHKYFGLSSDYSERKIVSETIANEYLYNFDKFTENTRKHDISDAMLMTIYYFKMEIEKKINVTKFEQPEVNFEEFRFNFLQK